MNQKNQFRKVENRGRIESGMTERGSTQSGRSMVEMLGVLAVIGVLSVGGIVGYKKAITSHRASETISRLMRRAVVIAGQVGLGQTADLSGFNPTDGTYKIPNSITTPQGQFALTVEAVPPEVCQKITDMWTLPAIQPGPCGSETADMIFTFNNDLTDLGGGAGGEEGEGEGEGKCPDGCPEGYNCVDGECAYPEGEYEYCYHTNADKQCSSRKSCSYANTGYEIVGVPDAWGTCAPNATDQIYCRYTNADGECDIYDWCYKDCTITDAAGSNDRGRCDCSNLTEVQFCYYMYEESDCLEYATCYKECGYENATKPHVAGSCGCSGFSD